MNLYLVRHAQAGDRHAWEGPDVERPLSKKGGLQAEAIADALGSRPVERVLSSPAVRCLQTVGPLQARLGLDIEATPAFAEGAPLRAARKIIDALAADGRDVVICGHGDLIPDLLHDLEHAGVRIEGAGCAKGSVWHVVAEKGRFVRADYYRRPDPELTSGV